MGPIALRRPGVRSRILIVISLVCGSLSGLLFWKATQSSQPADQRTEAQAKKLGFDSLREWDDVQQFDRGVVGTGLYAKHTMTETDLATLAKVVPHGSIRAQILCIFSLDPIQDPNDRQKVLNLLGTQPIPAQLQQTWLDLFKRWGSIPKGSNFRAAMKASGNPDVVRFAGEMGNGK